MRNRITLILGFFVVFASARSASAAPFLSDAGHFGLDLPAEEVCVVFPSSISGFSACRPQSNDGFREFNESALAKQNGVAVIASFKLQARGTAIPFTVIERAKRPTYRMTPEQVQTYAKDVVRGARQHAPSDAVFSEPKTTVISVKSIQVIHIVIDAQSPSEPSWDFAHQVHYTAMTSGAVYDLGFSGASTQAALVDRSAEKVLATLDAIPATEYAQNRGFRVGFLIGALGLPLLGAIGGIIVLIVERRRRKKLERRESYRIDML